ncbi:MAG: DUF3137 domain-containing protein [Acholeplasmataceae bacterium]|nr:DUF3137 domain-containing protein [Acholeplasmataceae bacterium]
MYNLDQLEEKRLKLYSSYKQEQKYAILGFVGFAIMLFITLVSGVQLLFILVAIFLIIAIVFFGKASIHVSTFRTMIKSELIMTLLKEQFDDVHYDQHQYITQQRIHQTAMVKNPDRYKGEDFISGVYKKVKFEVSDVEMKERVETRDSKGNTTVSYQTYFKGRWYIFKFARTFKDILKIAEGRGYQMNTRGLVKIDTESIEFNKKFAIFASTQEYGFYHITSTMIEKLLELEKLHKGSILYCFMNNELHIGVNDRKDYMELSLKTPINKEALTYFIGDIDLIPAIINELRLDSSKFNQEL